MKKEITLELEEEVITEFENIEIFFDLDETSNLIKPTIQEILRKYIIDSINERRIELTTSQAAINTDILKESNITIKKAMRL